MASGGDEDAGESSDRVLSADELDIGEREEVESLGDDRYVIGPDGPPTSGGDAADASDAGQADDAASTERSEPRDDDATGDGDAASDGAEPEVTGRDVKEWLADDLTDHDSAYAYRIAAKTGDGVQHQQYATDDVGAAFDGLLAWYARQVADDTSVEEALGILLAASSVRVRYPTVRLLDYLDAHDLDPEDSIADLVETVSAADGLAFPERE